MADPVIIEGVGFQSRLGGFAAIDVDGVRYTPEQIKQALARRDGVSEARPAPASAPGDGWAALAKAEEKARLYASYYAEGSDGRNTFIMLADYIAALRQPDTAAVTADTVRGTITRFLTADDPTHWGEFEKRLARAVGMAPSTAEDACMAGGEVRCVNAHDRCYEGGSCPYCEPDPDPRDAQIARLTEQVRMARGGLKYYAAMHKFPNDGPWGVNGDDFGTVARETLTRMERMMADYRTVPVGLLNSVAGLLHNGGFFVLADALNGIIDASPAPAGDLVERVAQIIEAAIHRHCPDAALYGTADDARSIIAAMQPGWRDMESAPLDGTPILIARPTEWMVEEGWHVVRWDDHPYIDGEKSWVCHDGKTDSPLRGPDPTHWQPLPAPPGVGG
jgi:hypothetical protein